MTTINENLHYHQPQKDFFEELHLRSSLYYDGGGIDLQYSPIIGK